MYYHGTNSNQDFKQLTPNALGLIWVTKDKDAARKYASKYYNEGIQRIFHLSLGGLILDFTNKENEDVLSIIHLIKSRYLFDLEKNWEDVAGFDILEANLWIIDELKSKGYSGIYVLDQAAGLSHKSIALFTDQFEIESIEYL